MLTGGEQRESEESLGGVAQKPVHGTGPALAPLDMSKSLFNATPRDGDAVGLLVDAIPQEGVCHHTLPSTFLLLSFLVFRFMQSSLSDVINVQCYLGW